MMKTYLPNYCKKIGIALVVIAVVLSIAANIDDFLNGFFDGYNSTVRGPKLPVNDFRILSAHTESLLTWISLSFSFSGFLLYLFSKEKIEDEFIEKLRYVSLAKSLLITWIIAAMLIVINGDVQLYGLYILQFQLFMYVVIYNYYKKWKFS